MITYLNSYCLNETNSTIFVYDQVSFFELYQAGQAFIISINHLYDN